MNKIVQTLFYTLTLFIFTSTVQAQETQPRKLSGKALFGGLSARQIGPAVMSGRVTTIDVVNKQPEIMYVGAGGGGVWKSISGGANFRPIFDDHSQSIGKIAIDQNHPDTLWVGTGETWTRNSVSIGTGIYKSTDGGSTWQNKGLRDSERIADILIHPNNPNTIYVAVLGHLWDANEERGIYKTTDGGDTWEQIFYIDENTGCTDLEIDPENPDILYATMWSFRRYPWSFDSGFTGNSGVFKSTNGGADWNSIQEGLPKDTLGRMAIAVAPSNGNVLYLSVEAKEKEDKGLYRSDDKGNTWKRVSNDFNTIVRPFYFSHLLVDPTDENTVYKCGLFLIISEDGGERFRGVGGNVHSDSHAVWVNPKNNKHIILGTDGGVYESVDKGYSFKMFMNLPLSQFYHVSVDMEEPYNIYGGLQDNGSWYAPSQKAGGISNSDWQFTFGGDGFYSFRHPTDPDIVFAEYQGGNLARYNKKTGRAKEIKPYPDQDDPKFRFNWNAPIHLSPNDPERIYFGGQFLFVSNDKGDTWKKISKDLTTNDPKKQEQSKSGGLSIDNSTAENHCTIYTIAESYKNGNTVWVGTDDGNLQVTSNGGSSWNNVIKNVPNLPPNTWITFIDPSHHDANTAYVAFDGHRTGDKNPYLYKTTDLGKTWKNLATDDIEGYALSVREDPVNPNLLFLGTEFGLYISVDGGEIWSRFENSVPKVGIRDMVIHPRDHALVMGTHGRGVIILDDLSPLRQVKPEILTKKIHFFDTEPVILKDPGAGGNWFGGDGTFTGDNPNRAAQIVYYNNKRHTFGKMYLEIYNDKDELLKTLPAGKSAGINIVEMPTQLNKPKSAPTNNRMALFGSLFGPNLPAGKYKVRLVKGKEEYFSGFELQNDPKSIYSERDRNVQIDATYQLYDMTEQMAHLYHNLEEMKEQANKHIKMQESMEEDLTDFTKKVDDFSNTLVALGGDFYVDEEEKIRERISDLYRQVSGYPGRPSNSQLDRIKVLVADFEKVVADFEMLKTTDLASINENLKMANVNEIILTPFDEFIKDE